MADQRFVDHRPDVLSYLSAPFDRDIRIAGAVSADLYASTSGTDSGFIVKLIDVYRQHQTDGLLPRDAFIFDTANNHYVCPQGKILKHRTAHAENRIHTYRATAGACKSCPIRPQCTRGTKRTLSVPFDESARQEAAALRNTEAFQHSRRLRKKVEMLFAHMKQHLRFSRLKLRGIAGAAEEFLLLATIQNLRRLARLRPPNIPTAQCQVA